MGYGLQANNKTREGSKLIDREAQFQYITTQAIAFLTANEPVISSPPHRKIRRADNEIDRVTTGPGVSTPMDLSRPLPLPAGGAQAVGEDLMHRFYLIGIPSKRHDKNKEVF
jgi:hypothetical protein